MRRLIMTMLPICLAVFSGQTVNAEDFLHRSSPLVKFGIEWGGGASLFETHRYVYADEVWGTLQKPDTHNGPVFETNAYLLLNVGFNVSQRSLIQLETGYMGVYGKRRMVPFMVRYSFLPKGVGADGVLIFGEAGIALPSRNERRISHLLSAGSGYRFELSRSISLDCLLSLRICYDHPEVIDSDTGNAVPAECIRRNNAVYGIVDFGLALNF